MRSACSSSFAAGVATFFGLTVINPLTVVYFAALVAGLDTTVIAGTRDRVVFATAAFIASLTWQLALAAFGAVVGGRLSDRAAHGLRIAGAAAVLGFAVRAALQAAG